MEEVGGLGRGEGEEEAGIGVVGVLLFLIGGSGWVDGWVGGWVGGWRRGVSGSVWSMNCWVGGWMDEKGDCLLC